MHLLPALFTLSLSLPLTLAKPPPLSNSLLSRQGLSCLPQFEQSPPPGSIQCGDINNYISDSCHCCPSGTVGCNAADLVCAPDPYGGDMCCPIDNQSCALDSGSAATSAAAASSSVAYESAAAATTSSSEAEAAATSTSSDNVGGAATSAFGGSGAAATSAGASGSGASTFMVVKVKHLLMGVLFALV